MSSLDISKMSVSDLAKLQEDIKKQMAEKAEAEKEKRKEMFVSFIKKNAYTEKEIRSFLSKEPKADAKSEPIIKWQKNAQETHIRYSGTLGKPPVWMAEMRQVLTKEEALKFALNDKGIKAIEKLYKPK